MRTVVQEIRIRCTVYLSLQPSSHEICNLRSGPLLAVLISLTATTKIGPDTNSLTFVLTAARFWP